MKTQTRNGAVLAGIGCLVSLMTATVAQSAPEQNSDDPGANDASGLFAKRCAKCHGRDGRAKRFHGQLLGARNLTDARWQASVTDERIAAAIRRGPGAMPSFEKKLSAGEIDALVTHVRHLRKEPEPRKEK
jgi:mono/diheme cytochrome c family protein